MKIAVLGSGMVGQAHGTRLVELGHQVMMGSRTADNPKAADWVDSAGEGASQGTFEESARFGDIVFNCTLGLATLDALQMAGAGNLKNKILVDISNPLDFSNGMPPTLSVCNDDSLGEQIQRAFPETRVVKTLNTANCDVQVNPSVVPGDHDAFVSGNNEKAKAAVVDILENWYGWKTVIDLGDITTARGTEQLMPIWIRLRTVYGDANFNFKIVR